MVKMCWLEVNGEVRVGVIGGMSLSPRLGETLKNKLFRCTAKGVSMLGAACQLYARALVGRVGTPPSTSTSQHRDIDMVWIDPPSKS
jgi:hypothetical protein